jgi:hypothetical protein
VYTGCTQGVCVRLMSIAGVSQKQRKRELKGGD